MVFLIWLSLIRHTATVVKISGGGVGWRVVRPLQGGTDSEAYSTDTKRWNRFAGGTTFRKYLGGAIRTGGTWAERYGKKIIAWDVAPGKEYFDELFRVSRNQIIWGGNYFDLPPTRCFIVWDKINITENFSMAACEYAWASFDDNAKIFRHVPQGTPGEPRFHPTQKPIALYSWLLARYAKPGDKILDTHVGSASSLIACHRAGFEAWGFEIDPGYYAKAAERLEREKAQVSLFDAGVCEGLL